MQEVNREDGEPELVLTCDQCERTQYFYGSNLKAARVEAKSEDRKSRKIGEEREQACGNCEFDD